MHLPIMNQIYRDPCFIDESFFEFIFKPYPASIALFATIPFGLALISGLGLFLALMAAILSLLVYTIFGFMNVLIHHYFSYKKLIKNIKGHYKLRLNSYFKIIYDEARVSMIALAYGYRDDFNPSELVLAEYQLENWGGNIKKCYHYDSKLGTTIFTKYGLLIKVTGVDENGYLEFEIIGLKKLGLLFT